MAGEQQPNANVNPKDAKSSINQVDRIESGNRTEEINIASVSHLFADIQSYNQQFSMGNILARGLKFALFEEQDATEPVRPFENEGEKQQVTAEALSILHGETLRKIGLVMEPVYGGATLMGIGEDASTKEMRLNVANGNQFTSFLHALEPQQVETTGLQSNLESLSEVLTKQLFVYDLNKPNDEALQLIGGLGRTVEEYKRLGMDKSVTKLEAYLQHVRQGDLREYVAIENGGFLSEPGKYFGPADWERDMTPGNLENRWDTALNILIMTRDNPKAHALYEQLGPHLQKCVDIAKGFIQSHETTEYYPQAHKDKMYQVLNEASQRLEAIVQPDKK